MHGGMVWKSLQTLCHVNHIVHLRIAFVETSEFRIHLQGLFNGDSKLHGHHFCHLIHLGIREIQSLSHSLQNTSGCHGSKGYNLGHGILSVFLGNIGNGTISLCILKVHVDIRHGDSLRIQETLEKQIVLYRINICNSGTVAHLTSCRRTTPRPYPAVVVSAPVDIVPHNQNVFHKPHGLNNSKLILHVGINLPALFFGIIRIGFIFSGKALLA